MLITVIKQPERLNEISLQHVSLLSRISRTFRTHRHRQRQRHHYRYRHANTNLSICGNQIFAAGKEAKQFSRKFL